MRPTSLPPRNSTSGRNHVDRTREGELARRRRLEVEEIHGYLARSRRSLVGGEHVAAEQAAVEAARHLDDDELHFGEGKRRREILHRVGLRHRSERKEGGDGELKEAGHVSRSDAEGERAR